MTRLEVHKRISEERKPRCGTGQNTSLPCLAPREAPTPQLLPASLPGKGAAWSAPSAGVSTCTAAAKGGREEGAGVASLACKSNNAGIACLPIDFCPTVCPPTYAHPLTLSKLQCREGSCGLLRHACTVLLPQRWHPLLGALRLRHGRLRKLLAIGGMLQRCRVRSSNAQRPHLLSEVGADFVTPRCCHGPPPPLPAAAAPSGGPGAQPCLLLPP